MIRLILHDNGTSFLSFTVKGHSTQGQKGNDILCAGVSTLAQSIVLTMKTVLKLNIGVEKKDGYLYCGIPDSLDKQEKLGVDLLIMTMVTGIQDLKNQYPNEIEIIWESN